MGKSLVVLLLLSVGGVRALAKTSPTQLDHVTGNEIIAAINLARQQPWFYANLLEQMRARFRGRSCFVSDNVRLQTHEGVHAVDDAVRFLRKARPVPALAVSPGLCQAAADHCREQIAGAMGHGGLGRTNPGSRMRRYGLSSAGWAENICYGQRSAREIVLAFIVDDGVRGRGHRKNLFNPAYRVAGAGFGPHAKFGSVCTVDFAGAYSDLAVRSGETTANNSFSGPRAAAAGLFQ